MCINMSRAQTSPEPYPPPHSVESFLTSVVAIKCCAVRPPLAVILSVLWAVKKKQKKINRVIIRCPLGSGDIMSFSLCAVYPVCAARSKPGGGAQTNSRGC